MSAFFVFLRIYMDSMFHMAHLIQFSDCRVYLTRRDEKILKFFWIKSITF